MEEAQQAPHATDDAFATAEQHEDTPAGPDIHAMQEVGHAGDHEHLPSGVDSADRATLSLQSSAEAAPADSSFDKFHAASPSDDGSGRKAAPSERVLDREHRPDSSAEDAQQQPGVFALTAIHCTTIAALQMQFLDGNSIQVECLVTLASLTSTPHLILS